MPELKVEKKLIKDAALSTLIIVMDNTEYEKTRANAYREIYNRLNRAGMDDATIDRFINAELDNLYDKEEEPLFLESDLMYLGKKVLSLYFNYVHGKKVKGLMFNELVVLRYMDSFFKLELKNIEERIVLKETPQVELEKEEDYELVEDDYEEEDKFNNMYDDTNIEVLRKAKYLLEELSQQEYEYVFKYLYDIDNNWINHRKGLESLVIDETKGMRNFIAAVQFSINIDKRSIDYETSDMGRILSKYRSNIIVFPTKKNNN